MALEESLDTYIDGETARLSPFKAKAHTPPYLIHRYFARRPWNLFERLVRHYSKPNNIVLDPFCGGGVTVYEALKLNRKIVACDLNPLSTYVISNMFHKSLPGDFDSIFGELDAYIQELCEKSFATSCPRCRRRTKIGWYELAHAVKCPTCSNRMVLSENNKVRNGLYRCQNLRCKANREGVKVARIARQDPEYQTYNGKCDSCQRTFGEKVNPHILKINRDHIAELADIANRLGAVLPPLEIPLNWDRQKEDLLFDKGIRYFQDLFTKKNLYINYLILQKINTFKEHEDTFNILRFIFSDSLRETNIMTFSLSGWQNGKPNSWAKHAYWIPSEFCEQNVYLMFLRSLKSLNRSITFNNQQIPDLNPAHSYDDLVLTDKNILIRTGSIDQLHLPSASVDVIITDPPYGSNVQYLELCHFWYLWNKDVYDEPTMSFEREAIVNRKSHALTNGKTYREYEKNLLSVYLECFRVLKNDGLMVMTFNNKDLNSWLALLVSVFKAGFHFEKGSITFQEGVANYKHTAHTKARGSPYGDYVYEFVRGPDYGPIPGSADRNKLLAHIQEGLDSAYQAYIGKLEDKNVILMEFFNNIVPEIESFVRANLGVDVSHDLYDVFTKNHLGFLYE
jgi:DNA modification methylase